MKVPIFDLRVKNKLIREELRDSLEKVISKGRLFLGDQVDELEKKVAKFLGVKYALGVSSGSSAIYLALRSSGIKKNDEVITTPLSWIIPSNAIVAANAIPVFADVRNDFNIDPNSISLNITNKTKVILPMHYAGHMCEMKKIKKIAIKNKLKIVEDAAQAFGASIDNKKAGTFSSAAGFSMNPMKMFGGYGEGGMVVTNSKKIFDKLKILRHAGTTSDYKKIVTNNCLEVSLNHKMDTITASFLLVAFKHLKEKKSRIDNIADFLNKNLHKNIISQNVADNEVHGRYVYPIIIDKNRDKLRNYLQKNNIETKIFNYPLIYNAPAFKKYKKSKLKTAEKLLKTSLIIPCHDKLSDNQIEYMVKTINNFFN
tara:strand:+ start:1102 stop:2211 length:1110 start_codon:yes stop_codon:yes gene_type:complete